MALKVKIEKVETKGKVLAFFVLLFVLLIIFAAFMIAVLLIFGNPISRNYYWDYVQFFPLTVVVPLIIALTMTMSHKTSLMRISPANNVNIDKIQEFLFKNGYKLVEEKAGFIRFEKSRKLLRFFMLNIDKPTIEVTSDEVLLTIDKHTEVILTPMLTYGKKFELNPEN